jgi:hypothetical protein
MLFLLFSCKAQNVLITDYLEVTKYNDVNTNVDNNVKKNKTTSWSIGQYLEKKVINIIIIYIYNITCYYRIIKSEIM